MIYEGQEFASPQEALAHYGAKGMKWGVRKSEETAKTQAPTFNKEKALLNEKQAAQAQTRINEIKANPSKWSYVQQNRNARVVELEIHRDQRLKDAKDIREGRYTDGQKKAIKGAAVVGGLLVAYGAYKFVDSGQAHQLGVQGKEFLTGKKSMWPKNDFLASKMSENDLLTKVVQKVNPDYGGIGTKMNCRRCTFAYELRRRGYDVSATKSVSGTGQVVTGLLNATDPDSNLPTGRVRMVSTMLKEQFSEEEGGPLTSALAQTNSWGKTPIGTVDDFVPSKSASSRAKLIYDSFGKEPDGARGELGVQWSMGGGHSMAWEIVGGKPVIFDAQSGKKYGTPEDFEKFAGTVTQAGYTRLDNVKLNTDYLKRWIQNAD